MSEQAPDRLWSGKQVTKVAAGTLAAVSAAVIGSFLGVAGTVIGAAVASIVGSVGTEIYQRSLDRGAKKLQTLAPTFIKAPAAVGTPAVPAASEDDSPSHTVPEEERTEAETRTPLPWRRVALAAGVLFVLTLGTLSVVELLAGRSVASMVGNDAGGRTTVSRLVGDDRDERQRPAPAPATSSAPQEEPTSTGTPDGEPTATPTTEAPSTAPTTGAPTTAPTTEAPTTEAPTTEAPETQQQQDQDQQDQQQDVEPVTPDE
ncbi:hypothetical protein [Jidongwangia harbinensis]|uniref:hypothetical protein n=1 Tax=Jidongwangia harbinensis TaxID=2878561 RepID=UPI001CD96CFD|nr:hypothetical protein [Jidongwangia harbinensis]MCA2216416.1 hypothetical protein [Jidongwangia harbinensis]